MTWTAEPMSTERRTTDTLNAMTDALFEVQHGETKQAQESIVYAIRQFAVLTGIEIAHLEEALEPYNTKRSIPAR